MRDRLRHFGDAALFWVVPAVCQARQSSAAAPGGRGAHHNHAAPITPSPRGYTHAHVCLVPAGSANEHPIVPGLGPPVCLCVMTRDAAAAAPTAKELSDPTVPPPRSRSSAHGSQSASISTTTRRARRLPRRFSSSKHAFSSVREAGVGLGSRGASTSVRLRRRRSPPALCHFSASRRMCHA